MITTKEKNFKTLLRKLLYSSPNWLQYLVSFFYLRYSLTIKIGPIKYIKFYKFLEESQWWPRWKLEQYQTEKLKALIRYAYDNVPYYTEVFKKARLTPQDFNSIKDIKKLPILTKEDVLRNIERLISQKINKNNLKMAYTSGSTGKPMQFYRDKHLEFIQLAFLCRQYDLMNIKIHDRHVYLRCRPFMEKNINGIYLYEPYLRRLSLSSIAHSLDLCDRYLELIKEFAPVFIQGSPSMLYNLACYAQENSIEDIKFKYFINYFENLFPYQRKLIEKQFKCQAYNIYLSEERVMSAFECPKHEGMHIEMERGILEIIGDDGEALPEEKLGRIIVTGLHNFAMPLIRYDIGDIGSVSEKPCSCGRGLPLLKSFDGRANEVIKYKDKYIYSTTLSVILWRFENIKDCQFVQEREDELILNIVKRSGFSENDADELIKTLREMLNEKLNITINFVDYIPRSRMGKFSFIVSKLSNAYS